MNYGRRFFNNRKFENVQSWKWVKNPTTPTEYQAIRWRIFLTMVAFVGFVQLVFLTPLLYFVIQNYKHFVILALRMDPSLVTYLEREKIWILGFGFFGFLLTTLVTSFLAYRLVNSILKPIQKVEEGLSGLIHQKWSDLKLNFDRTTELPRLADEMSRLVDHLVTTAQLESRLLRQLAVDPSNRDAIAAFTQLKSIKANQVSNVQTGVTERPEVSSSSGEVHFLNHAS